MSAYITASFGDPFTEVAALNDNWPVQLSDQDAEHLVGRAKWASSYWAAANTLYGERDVRDFIMFAGPVMQNAGLACELVLKCLLFGGGRSDASLRKLGHSLDDLFSASEQHFDVTRFLVAVVRASEPIPLPKEVADNFIKTGGTREEADLGWRVFSQHLRILDETYDRPYRARYMNAGPIVLPEPYILLIGSLILLNAMNERLGLPLVAIADQASA